MNHASATRHSSRLFQRSDQRLGQRSCADPHAHRRRPEADRTALPLAADTSLTRRQRSGTHAPSPLPATRPRPTATLAASEGARGLKDDKVPRALSRTPPPRGTTAERVATAADWHAVRASQCRRPSVSAPGFDAFKKKAAEAASIFIATIPPNLPFRAMPRH